MARSKSSKRWLAEHFDDPYVKAAQQQGLRSRAAFKLQELQERFKLLCEYDGSEARLYDVEVDPGETTDLSARYPDVVRRLTKAVVAWHRAMPADAGETDVRLGKDS